MILFDRECRIVASDQREHRQIHPRAGWVEHDAEEIWQRTREVIGGALAARAIEGVETVAIGPTNQRETTVVWERDTGRPLHNAIVWQDTRTAALVGELAGDAGADRLREAVGLPLSTYFSGPKIAWLLDRVPGARARAENGELAFGNIDTWLLWNLTGGPRGGVHATDVTNASRTMLMDLQTLDWHPPSLDLMGIPAAMLPEIRSSSELFGEAAGTALGGRPIAGIMGDQQAALFGQSCFEAGGEGRRRPHELRDRGIDRGHGRGGAGAARSDRADPHRRGGRGSRSHRRGQRGRLLRPGLLRAVRTPLARRCSRRDRRADRLCPRRTHRAGGVGGCRLADPRGARRRPGSRGYGARRAEGRRRHDRQP